MSALPAPRALHISFMLFAIEAHGAISRIALERRLVVSATSLPPPHNRPEVYHTCSQDWGRFSSAHNADEYCHTCSKRQKTLLPPSKTTQPAPPEDRTRGFPPARPRGVFLQAIDDPCPTGSVGIHCTHRRCNLVCVVSAPTHDVCRAYVLPARLTRRGALSPDAVVLLLAQTARGPSASTPGTWATKLIKRLVTQILRGVG